MSLNRQLVIDTVAVHLLGQGEKATCGEGGGCRYRAKAANGKLLKSAIGALIPDELYDPQIEGSGISGRTQDCVDPRFGLIREVEWNQSYSDCSFLAYIQRIHDEDIPSVWIAALGHAYFRYDLDPWALRMCLAFGKLPASVRN